MNQSSTPTPRTSTRGVALVSLFLERTTQSLPLGAACLCAVIKADAALAQCWQPSITEGYQHDDLDGLADRVAKSHPALVCFSVFVWNLERSLALAAKIRARLPQALLIAGGAQVTALPQELLRASPKVFDATVCGEGEAPFAAILRVLNDAGQADRALMLAAVTKANIPGVWTAEKPASVGRSPFLDPVALPSPWLLETIKPAAYEGLLWEMARGCPFHCAFCFESGGPASVRKIPLERLEKELDWFARHKASLINVLDPTFNADPERAVTILRMLKTKARGMRFTFEVRAEFLDPAQARLFSQLSCSVQIGIQTTTPAALKAIGRGFNEKLFRQKIALMNQNHVVFGFDLIYGLPGDTLEGFCSSLDFALRLQPNHMDVFPLNILPGTRLSVEADQLGIRHQSTAPYQVISTPGFGTGDLEKAAQLHRACDLFYTQGRAVAWFLVCLKAIGQTPARFLTAFYHWAAAAGRLPAQVEPDSAVLEALQLDFIKSALEQAGETRLWPAAADLIRFHAAYGRANIEGKACDLPLNHHPEFILGPGGLDLRLLANQGRAKATVRMKPHQNGVDMDW